MRVKIGVDEVRKERMRLRLKAEKERVSFPFGIVFGWMGIGNFSGGDKNRHNGPFYYRRCRLYILFILTVIWS